MRDYTRKAKRVDNGEWIAGYYVYVDYLDKHYILASCKEPLGVNSFVAMKEYEVDPTTICEPTGLTDKNGNEIWENDIVRYYDDLAKMNKEDLVKWNETHSSFVRLHKSQMGLQYLYIDECIANRCEVIGNVFDNADLLKE